MKWQGIFQELRRRHVFRIGAAYLVSAWLLLQLGAIVFPAFGAPHWAIRILFGILALGFLASLILAWAFEFTPEGVRRTEDADSEKARSPETHRRIGHVLNAAIMIMLLAAVGVLAWRLYLQPAITSTKNAATAIPANSIAVLPLLDLSPKHNQGYFASGIAEQLLDILAQATDLKVVARTSAFQFQGKAEDVRKIGKMLDVRHILEGSVLRDGKQVRISVQLVNTKTGYHEWSHTYQRKMSDIFTVQDEITRAIASALEAKLVSRNAVAKADPPANPDAYDEYLLGRHLMNERTRKSLEQALVHLKKSIKLDPDYAAPYAQIAIVYMLLDVGDEGDYTWSESLKLAKPYLDRAIALAPNASDTQAAHGRYVWAGRGGDARALPYFNRAVEANPSYMDPLVWKALALNRLGRHDEALQTLREGAARDPFNWMVNQDLVDFLLRVNRYSEAEKIARRFVSASPARGHLMMFMVDNARNDFSSAVHDLLGALEKRPGWMPARMSLADLLQKAGLYDAAASLRGSRLSGMLAAYAGHRTKALKQVHAMLERYPNESGAHLGAAEVFLLIGERDAARRQFDAALQLADNRGRDIWRCQCWVEGAAYASLLKRAGDEDQAKELVGRLRSGIAKQLAQYRKTGRPQDADIYTTYSMAGLDAVSGDLKAALTGLQKSIEQAVKHHTWFHSSLFPLSLERMPQFDPLRGDPRFKAIVTQLKERQAKLRAKMLPVLCNQTYRPDAWHPPKAVCAGITKAVPGGTVRKS